MAATGKILVLGNILKLDRPFRPPNIVDMTGLDRQLVRYHLNKLCESGYLEKIDKHYVVKDKEGLLSSLIEETEHVETAKPTPAGFITADTLNNWNIHAESLVAARTLDLPMSFAARQGMLNKIDDTVKLFKQLRKYLTNSTKTKGSAAKYVKGMPEASNVLWKILTHYSGETDITVDLAEFEAALKEAMIEDE